MIQYRSFRNPDSPAVLEAWNASFSGKRIAPARMAALLEFFTFSKPYFDPNGLILAFDDAKPVGLVHAGFVAGPGMTIETTTGVICLLGVAASHRRQGIGVELLRRAEEYLRSRGAKEILAGPMTPNNPFTFGLYGGSDSPGFLASDVMARPFFEKHGYAVVRSMGVFQRQLARAYVPADPRFLDVRQKYDIMAAPLRKAGWWRESVLGPVEAVEYRLQEKNQGPIVARCVLWDMETITQTWNETCVGQIELYVEPTYRRQALGRYLLAQILRHLREQSFSLFEAMVPLDSSPAIALLQGLEFQQVDTGYCYRRTEG